jgi:hypothetical protein
MENTNRTPVITEQVNLSYTRGVYSFFAKSVAKLFAIAIAILNTAGDVVNGEAARTLVSCLWVVHHNANKLQGIDSISSSVHDNCLCAAWRKLKGCICQHCYAHNQQAYQNGLKEHNILNGIILRNVLLPVCAFRFLPILFPYLRIESFGDIANVIQACNYLRIIKAFPEKRCAIWSKNLALWDAAIKTEGKPKNTTFVASSPYVNKPFDMDILQKYDFIDHVFTVYDKKYAKEHAIRINCGGIKCMECLKAKKGCYYHGGEFYVNELLK